VKPKYRTKNNITEPVSLFLNIRKYINARTSESSILRLTETSVRKTLFSAFLANPLKKTSIAAMAIRVKLPVRGKICDSGKKEGNILFTPSNPNDISRAKINNDR